MSDPNTINALMDMDPLDCTPTDIQAIVDYHRRNRALVESGAKPKKDVGPAPKVSSADLGIVAKAPQTIIRRRVL